tara:strand:+ start:681 stop:2165 length:1485 start_codon:yes stop_codon:yes gene_type:complete
MELNDLITGISAKETWGKLDSEVRAVQYDSRKVEPGDIFVAMRGEVADGHRFVEKAIEQGAVAIVAEEAPQSVNLDVGWIRVADSRAALGPIAAQILNQPSRDLKLAGITGTNGKTTTAFLVQHLCNAAQRQCGLIGTVRYDTGGRTVEASRTTPESSEVHQLLAEMREFGCRAGVMEVSSHGLQQHRVAGVEFDVAVFTNLSQDHLDFHGSMQDYYEAKRILFQHLEDQSGDKQRSMVVNGDDNWGQRLLRQNYPNVRKLSFGMGVGRDFRAINLNSQFEGTSFTLEAKKRQFMVRSPMIGAFNVYNSIAALATATAMGLNLREAIQHLADGPQVPGRMESVDSGMPFRVFVDYAHTPDALEKACATLRELKPKRLITVFGCGGDRDRDKRPLMARAASVGSDAVLLTSDNPRTEDPQQILEDAKKGLAGVEFAIIEDRETAIREAIMDAGEKDIVLIAGKGHENYQELADGRIDFDDRLVAQHAINDLRNQR